MTGTRVRPLRRVCVLGLGGGGFHFAAERLIAQMPETLEFVLVYSIDTQTRANWPRAGIPHRAFVVRSPALLQDPWSRRFRSLVAACWRALAILVATRPDCVLAVGTAQAVPFGIAARLTGTPLVFIESLTRVDRPSRTGQILAALRLPALHYVQWPRLASSGRVRFVGSMVS